MSNVDCINDNRSGKEQVRGLVWKKGQLVATDSVARYVVGVKGFEEIKAVGECWKWLVFHKWSEVDVDRCGVTLVSDAYLTSPSGRSHK